MRTILASSIFLKIFALNALVIQRVFLVLLLVLVAHSHLAWSSEVLRAVGELTLVPIAAALRGVVVLAHCCLISRVVWSLWN